MYCFNSKKRSWSSVIYSGEAPPPSFRWNAAVVGEYWYFFFGSLTQDEFIPHLYAFNFSSHTWHIVETRKDSPIWPAMHPVPRSFPALASSKSSIWV